MADDVPFGFPSLAEALAALPETRIGKLVRGLGGAFQVPGQAGPGLAPFGALTPQEEALRPENVVDRLGRGVIEAVPHIAQKAGDAAVRNSLDWGDYDPSGNLEGALLTMGMTPFGAPAGAVGAGPIARTRGLPMDEVSRMARAQEQGFQGPWYHGSWRTDRLTESGAIDPRRATSGPMPFFTDNPEMASSYAMGKKGDTSLLDNGHIPDYFTVDPKALWPGSRQRTPVTVERSWNFLPPEVRADILNKSRRVGYENLDTGAGPFTLHPEGVIGHNSGEHFDWVLKNEMKGNPLAALRERWLEGGDLVNNPGELSNIFRLAGYPHPISEATAPWTEARGVLPAMLRMRNPLHTENQGLMLNDILPSLENEFKRDRTRLQQFGADMWDKNSRFTPRDWIANAIEDYKKGDNSFVWTSIPDKITDAFRRRGYDALIDTGGKMGGPGHRVAIPFSPDQVRSLFARFDPANEGKGALLGAGGPGALPFIPFGLGGDL